MKKWLVLFTILYCLSLCGCGNTGAGNGETTDSSQSTETNETTLSQETETTKTTTESEETTTEATQAPTVPEATVAPTVPETTVAPTVPETTVAPTVPETTVAPTVPETTVETVHTHNFGNWSVKEAPTCSKEGMEQRVCTDCQFEEMRVAEKLPHTYAEGTYTCSVCQYVNIDADESVVEMGVVTGFPSGNIANYAWDVHIFDGKIYRGAGDYDKNAGKTQFVAFNLSTKTWEKMELSTDMAIHTFVEIDGKLYAPGIDSTDSDGWAWGNYYVLEDGKWVKFRNIPNGIHCFDMIGFDNKIFVAMGGNNEQQMIAVSSDGGKTFSHLPIYRGSKPLDPSGYDPKWFRGYDFVEYNGNLYALLSYRINNGNYARDVYRYEGDKMVYVGRDGFSGRVGRNYWQAAFEWKDTCYIAAKGLFAITDFSSAAKKEVIAMPGKEIVSDAILHNDTMYTLGYNANADGSYQIAIYKSTTGKVDSFTQVANFKYEGMPYSFDFDGSYFYVGIGQPSANDASKAGMLLRVKP